MSKAPEENITKIRPRFKVESELSTEEVMGKIDYSLRQDDAKCTGKIHHQYATLYVPAIDQHYWSPQLSLTVGEEDGITIIRGVYGPRPTVWTMFVFFYSILGLAIMILGTIGVSYMMLDKAAGILWWVPILSMFFLTLYLVSYSGQRLGHKQTDILHHFLEDSLGINLKH